MRTRRWMFAITFWVSITLATVARSQPNEHARDGFLMGFNIGGGSAQLEIDADSVEVSSDDRFGGVAGNFRIGFAVSPTLIIGLESSAWVREEEIEGFGDELTQTNTLAVGAFAATWYPGQGGFFLRGGIGFGTYQEEVASGSVTVTFRETGFGVLAATGYEWRLTRSFALGPQLDLAYVDVGDIEFETIDGTVVDADIKFDYVNLTVLLNWYF